MEMSYEQGVCICGSCLAKAPLLHQVTSPAPSTDPNPITGGTPRQSLWAGWLSSAITSLAVKEGKYLPRVWQSPVKLLGGATGAHRVLGYLWVLPPVHHLGRLQRKSCDWQPSC